MSVGFARNGAGVNTIGIGATFLGGSWGAGMMVEEVFSVVA
jgi:hypothetical protein